MRYPDTCDTPAFLFWVLIYLGIILMIGFLVYKVIVKIIDHRIHKKENSKEHN